MGRPNQQTAGAKPKRQVNPASLANLTGGSRKGRPNKATSKIRDMVAMALDKAGGIEYLVKQAEKNPGPFLSLVGKVLPLQLQGDPDAPLSITITRNIVSGDK